MSGRTASREWCDGYTTCTRTCPKAWRPASSWKRTSFRIPSWTSSPKRATVEGTSYRSAGTTARNRTKYSVLKQSHRYGSADLYSITRHSRKARTCRWASNRPWHSNGEAGYMMTHPTLMRAPSGYYRGTQGNKIANRGSADAGEPQKTAGNNERTHKKNVVRMEIQAGREEGGQDGRYDRNEVLRDIHQQGA